MVTSVKKSRTNQQWKGTSIIGNAFSSTVPKRLIKVDTETGLIVQTFESLLSVMKDDEDVILATLSNSKNIIKHGAYLSRGGFLYCDPQLASDDPTKILDIIHGIRKRRNCVDDGTHSNQPKRVVKVDTEMGLIVQTFESMEELLRHDNDVSRRALVRNMKEHCAYISRGGFLCCDPRLASGDPSKMLDIISGIFNGNYCGY